MIRTDAFQLEFASDGKPASFKTVPGDKQLLNVGMPGIGFVIEDVAGNKMLLNDLSIHDGQLVAVSDNGHRKLFFVFGKQPNMLL